MDTRYLVDQIIGSDHRWAAEISASINYRHGLYNSSIWKVLDFPKDKKRILDIGPGSGLSSCEFMAKGHEVTVVEPAPFGAESIDSKQAVDLMSLLFYSIYNEKMPEFNFIKGNVQYSDIEQYEEAYFFFPHPREITPDHGFGEYNIGQILRKVIPRTLERLTIVTERPNPVLLGGRLTEHQGIKRLSQKIIDEEAWRGLVDLTDFDLNIIEYDCPEFNKL